MRGPLFVAALIAAVSVVPLFILDGVRGAFLTPVAQGFLAATVVSLVVALTVAPVLATLLLSRSSLQHGESPLARALERAYSSLLPRLLRRPVWSYALVGLLVRGGPGRPAVPRRAAAVPDAAGAGPADHLGGARPARPDRR